MKLKRIIASLAVMASGVMCLAGCTSEGSAGETVQASYEQISQEEAKKIMDTESGYVIIDARTQEEYDAGHINGAMLMPEYEVADRAEKELTDKNQLILVYCRSGRRSKIAAQALVDLGYTNVKEFGIGSMKQRNKNITPIGSNRSFLLCFFVKCYNME